MAFVLLVLLLLNHHLSNAQCNDFSGYFGGNLSDDIRGVTHDSKGNIYYVGSTQSADLLISPGKISDTISGGEDGFILKTDSCGNYIWSTYIGGNGADVCEKISIYNNQLYICGYTSSTNFPVTANAYMDTLQGSYDAFIIVVDTAGNLNWGSYFGGTGGDFAYDIDLDKWGNIYFGGSTSSNDLPTNTNSFQNNKSGAIDAFLVRLKANLQIHWCTYYGGSFGEDLHALCADKDGNAILTGGSLSNNLSTSIGAQQTGSAGGMDCYLLKLDSVGVRIFSTYYGGSGVDDSYAIDTDSSGTIYIGGNTTSFNYPVSTLCFQNSIGGSTDMHIDAFSSSGLNLWSTFYGGSDIEEIRDLQIINEEIILLGRTQSINFPTMGNPVQTNLNGSIFDWAFMKFSKNGNPFYSTYFGGSNEEAGNSFTNFKHSFYIGGTSYSTDYPNTPLLFQSGLNGVNDGALSKLFLPISIVGYPELAHEEFKIFPNPTNGQLTIENSDNIYEILISNLYGENIQRIRPETNRVKIVLESFPNGIYLITLKLNNGELKQSKVILSKG